MRTHSFLAIIGALLIFGAMESARAGVSGTEGAAGNGSSLTNLNASELRSGTVPAARHGVEVVTTNGTQTIPGDKTISGSLSFTSTTHLTNVNGRIVSKSFGLTAPNEAYYSGTNTSWALYGGSSVDAQNFGVAIGTDRVIHRWKAAANYATNFWEWQNSAGANIGWIGPSGEFYTTASINASSNTAAWVQNKTTPPDFFATFTNSARRLRVLATVRITSAALGDNAEIALLSMNAGEAVTNVFSAKIFSTSAVSGTVTNEQTLVAFVNPGDHYYWTNKVTGTGTAQLITNGAFAGNSYHEIFE